MAAYLAESDDPPRLALCSTARRTLETLEAVRARLALRCENEDALYLADAATLVARLARLDPVEDRVLLIGHNPGLHDLLVALVGSGKPRLRKRLEEGFPTGALAELEIDSPWSELATGAARLVALTLPRELD